VTPEVAAVFLFVMVVIWIALATEDNW